MPQGQGLRPGERGRKPPRLQSWKDVPEGAPSLEVAEGARSRAPRRDSTGVLGKLHPLSRVVSCEPHAGLQQVQKERCWVDAAGCQPRQRFAILLGRVAGLAGRHHVVHIVGASSTDGNEMIHRRGFYSAVGASAAPDRQDILPLHQSDTTSRRLLHLLTHLLVVDAHVQRVLFGPLRLTRPILYWMPLAPPFAVSPYRLWVLPLAD